MRSASLLCAAALLVCSCSAPTAPDNAVKSGPRAAEDAQSARPVRRRAVAVPSSTAAVVGVWGADDIALDLQPDGGRVELSCAHGTISQSLFTAADGTFSVRGTFTRESGAPPAVSDSPAAENARPATYQGKIAGQMMTLTITVDGDEFSETFSLVRDKKASIAKCP